ncbi:superoxide dismutase, Mn/Fe family [[Eubacterium] yurii subsp. margaretiae ATCC 43715]|nr:superoxide dismutase, Mn/Fe family [[Eubacterium] yurii subsp. margaretiae ATCC 43715]
MFEQVKLDYDFNALEPYIDTLTMETHYGKHHATYTKNFNEAVDKAGLSNKSIEEILSSLSSISDESLRNALQNNGGGYYNHNLYFSIMSPKKDTKPNLSLEEAIERDFGSLNKLIETLQNLAMGQFGSGWAFLSTDKGGKLYATKAANQNNPLMEEGQHTPILGIDVWEHAYYLKYKNLRGDYVKNFFEVLDWEKVSENYEKCK